MASLPAADLILHNGRIWRGYTDGWAEAVAVWQGKVLATGSDADMLALKGQATKTVDLEGRFACPGLNDNHLHLISTGLTMGWVDVTPAAAPTLQALLDRLSERAATLPAGTWIRARGYDQTKLDIGRHPTREELDRAVPGHPVLVTRACGHVSVANSMAFSLAGVSEGTEAPDGGVIGKADGRLDGFLAENAQNLVTNVIPHPTVEDLIEAIERGGRHLLSFGITSCMEAALGHVTGFDEMKAYQLAKLAGRLPVRVWLTLMGDPGVSIVEDCWRAGLVTGTGDDMMRIGGVKLFLDGSAGGRTAWMSRPYKDEPGNFGVRMLPAEEVERLVVQWHRCGYSLACHAIGDAAIDQLVTAYEKALALAPDPDRRHRVEHCGFLADGLNERMKAAGIYPAPQLAFIHDFGDSYISVMDEERARSCYPSATWKRMGLGASTGSDSPVCSPDPFPNIHAMITRQTWKGTVMDEAERLAPDEVLQAYTEGGAFMEKAEHVKGRLVPGQLADIAVFNNNLLEAAPATIRDQTHCVLTILGGKVVHDRRG